MLPALSAYFGITIDALFALTDETRMGRIRNMVWNEREISPAVLEREEEFLLDLARREPRNSRPYALLAMLENSAAQFHCTRAAGFVKESLRRGPEQKDAHSELVAAMGGKCGDWCADNHGQLIAWYKDFVEEYPEYRGGYQWLLDQLLDDGRLDEAKEYLERMAGADGTFRTPLYRGRIAWAAFRLGRALLPAAQITVLALFVDEAALTLASGVVSARLLWRAGWLAGVIAAERLLEIWSRIVSVSFRIDVDSSYERYLLDKQKNISYPVLEQRDTGELIERVVSGRSGQMTAGFFNILDLAECLLRAGGIVLIAMSGSAWTGLAVLLMFLIVVPVAEKCGEANYEAYEQAAQKYRRANYIRSILSGREYAGEDISAAAAKVRNYLAFLELPCEEQRWREEAPICGIDAKNMGFQYPDGTQALQRITFHAERDQMIAIVGENGSGKTTLKLCQQVIVLRRGRLVDCGTHEQLLSRCGYYRRLWHAQADQYV